MREKIGLEGVELCGVKAPDQLTRAVALKVRDSHREHAPGEGRAACAVEAYSELLAGGGLHGDNGRSHDRRHEEAKDYRQPPGGVLGDDVAVDEEPHQQRHRDGGHEANQSCHEDIRHARPRLAQDIDDHPA